MKINKSILSYPILSYPILSYFLAIVSALLFSQQIIAWEWKTFKVKNLSNVTITKIQVVVKCAGGMKVYKRHATFKNKYAVFSQTLPYGELQCYIGEVNIWISWNNKIYKPISFSAFDRVYLDKPDTFYIKPINPYDREIIGLEYSDHIIYYWHAR